MGITTNEENEKKFNKHIEKMINTPNFLVSPPEIAIVTTLVYNLQEFSYT